MTGVVEVVGGGGALVAAIWLWRLRTVARLIKFLGVSLLLVAALSIVGIVQVSVDVGAALEAARVVWDLGWRLWGAVS